ncbi:MULTISPECIES: hypothetical protein [Novosphingobium]|uniref:hypothetical protein n=1 Tax=Novosphingobium TaxID=165696 RepID=UPI0022F2548D|nr:hypothetical protein [Novosphingobium resinovorum]GLK42816.1 hypothetical protein GCM10017612_07330 [Novosphingobium resinovorum]
MTFHTITAGGLALVLAGQAALAQAPSELSDLVGSRAPGAETQMKARGYDLVNTQKGDDRSYTIWWNGDKRQCVTVATMNGRYDSITDTLPADCGHSTGHTRSDARDGDRDRGYHPDIGYARSTAGQRESPSYVEDRARFQVNDQNVDLGLVCFGDGQRSSVSTTYGWSWNARTNRYDYGNRTEMTGQQFDASLMLQFWEGGGRIRLPKKLVPPINSRGNDGWWDLYDVDMGPDVIRAKYRLNGLNKPLVTINRRSGQISVQGTASYAFRGTCDLIEGREHRRF